MLSFQSCCFFSSSSGHPDCGADLLTLFSEITANINRDSRALASVQQESTQHLYDAINNTLLRTAQSVYAASTALTVMPSLGARIQQLLLQHSPAPSTSTTAVDSNEPDLVEHDDLSFDSLSKSGSLEKVPLFCIECLALTCQVIDMSSLPYSFDNDITQTYTIL
jgi:hypothetical protein